MRDVTAEVNNGHEECIFKIPEIEAKYNAKYVGQLALRTSQGWWSEDSPGEVFYQETPPVKGYSNYFALIRRGGTIYITSGASAVEGVITGIAAKDGEIIYSRYRHDMRTSTDKSVWIDGGRDYVRTGGGHLVLLKIIDGKWFQLEEHEVEE
jgi:outer membrane protein assembly factor BamB